MSWSYSGDPSASRLDEVRFLIGDVDADDPQLTDAEINYLIGKSSSVYLAAAAAAEAIAAKYSRLCSKSVGDLSYNYAQRQEAYRRLALRLKAQAVEGTGPVAGGISMAEKSAVEMDQDRVRPAFRVDLHDAVDGNCGEGQW